MRHALVLFLSCAPTIGDVAPLPDAGAPVVFARDIRPLIDGSCSKCHYPGEQQHTGYDVARLDLSTLGGLRRGGLDTRTDIIVPYDAAASALVQKLRGTFPIGARMPRNGPWWSESNIELVERWIAQGAPGQDSD